jgi:hypothetical protein
VEVGGGGGGGGGGGVVVGGGGGVVVGGVVVVVVVVGRGGGGVVVVEIEGTLTTHSPFTSHVGVYPTVQHQPTQQGVFSALRGHGTGLITIVSIQSICRLDRLPADRSRGPSATEVVLLATTR